VGEVVTCPLCQLPSRAAAQVCDECGQPLGEAPDASALEAELVSLRQREGAGCALALFALAVTWLVSGGAFFLLVVPPAAVAAHAFWRGRHIRAHLARVRDTAEPTTF